MLEPLQGREYRTHDLDEMLGAVGRLLRPYDVRGRSARYDASMRHDRLGNLTFVTGDYGPEIELTVDALESFYVVQQPLTGCFRARSLGAELEFAGGDVHVMNPIAPTRMEWSRGCKMALFRLDRAVVDEHVVALTDAPVSRAPIFVERRSDALARYFDFLYRESRRADSPLHHGVGARSVEQTLVALLLGSRDEAAAPGGAPRPYYVKRAVDFIAANVAGDIGVADIVRASGVSARTLFYGFRRARGMGPIAWLRERRLERARAELACADPAATTVTEVALRLGFLHLGKFSAAYRARFGEPPSRTLWRRRRAAGS